MLWLKSTTRSPPTRSASTSPSQTLSRRRFWKQRSSEAALEMVPHALLTLLVSLLEGLISNLISIRLIIFNFMHLDLSVIVIIFKGNGTIDRRSQKLKEMG
jgi:hypothetical protein